MLVRMNDHCSVDTTQLGRNTRQDYLAIFAILPIICIARYVCERIGQIVFLSSRSAKKLRGKGMAMKLAVKKFEEATWKMVYYGFVASYGVLFISWEPFLRDFMGVYPNQVSTKVYWYYIIQLSFYTWMTVCLVWDVRRKDFNQMVAHHGVTLGLLMLSYSWQLTNAGALLMVLIDIADPFLELAKIFKYLGKETQSTITFAIFLISFVFLRLVLYPIYVLTPTLFYTWELALYMDKVHLYYIINGGLLTLLGLNVYWAILIIKVAVTKLKGGEMQDVRSDEEID